jgi:hypothetical protein
VVGKALVEARHQRHLHRHRQRHPPRCQLGGQAGVELVHLVVACLERRRGGAIALVPGVDRLAPHVGREVPHPLDEAAGARRELVAEDVVGPGCDLHDEVVRALELGHDPQHREQEAQVRGDGRLQQDLPVDQFLDLGVEGVDDLLAFGQRPEHLVAAGQQGLGGLGQILGDHGEQLDDLGLDGLQVTLEFPSGLDHAQSLLGAHRDEQGGGEGKVSGDARPRLWRRCWLGRILGRWRRNDPRRPAVPSHQPIEEG